MTLKEWEEMEKRDKEKRKQKEVDKRFKYLMQDIVHQEIKERWENFYNPHEDAGDRI